MIGDQNCSNSGYKCINCGMWVSWGNFHTCNLSSPAQPTPQAAPSQYDWMSQTYLAQIVGYLAQMIEQLDIQIELLEDIAGHPATRMTMTGTATSTGQVRINWGDGTTANPVEVEVVEDRRIPVELGALTIRALLDRRSWLAPDLARLEEEVKDRFAVIHNSQERIDQARMEMDEIEDLLTRAGVELSDQPRSDLSRWMDQMAEGDSSGDE